MHMLDIILITPERQYEIAYSCRVKVIFDDKLKQEILQKLKVDYNINDCKWEIEREVYINR